MLPFIYLMAFVWGIVWALFLQFAPLGQFLARKRTWITVVIGVGVDLLLVLCVIPWEHSKIVGMIVVLSAIGIIFRSLYNEWEEWGEWLDVFKDAGAEQGYLGIRGYYRRLSESSRGVAPGNGTGKKTDGSGNDSLAGDVD